MNDAICNQVIDATGLYCPEPIMMLHATIDDMELGDTCLLMATDPSTERDIKKFCQFLGHTLVLSEQENDLFKFIVQKN